MILQLFNHKNLFFQRFIIFFAVILFAQITVFSQNNRLSLPFLSALLVNEDNIMLPLEPLMQLLTGNITRSENGEISFSYRNKKVTLQHGNRNATINGVIATLPIAPLGITNITYLPADDCITALGGRFVVSKKEQIAYITFPGMKEPWQLPLEDITVPFEEYQDNDRELYYINTNNSDIHRLTYNAANDEQVAISFDDATFIYRQHDDTGTRIRQRKWKSPYSTLLCQSSDPDNSKMHSPLLSPDNKAIFYINIHGEQRRLYRQTIPGQQAILLAEDSSSPCFMPDRQTIIVNSAGEIISIHLPDGAFRTITKGNAQVISPNGKYLLYRETRRLAGFPEKNCQMLVTRVFGDGEDAGQCWRAEEKYCIADEFEPSFNTESTKIAFVRRGVGIYLMNPDRNELVAITENPEDRHPRFSQDGKSVIFLRKDQLCSLNIADKHITVVSPELTVNDFTISRDGSLILFSATISAIAAEDK